MSLEVLYEDNHIIAVNKKPSDIVQGDKTGDRPLSDFVKEYIKNKYNKPGNVYLGVTHRIDRPVSGVLIFAKTSKALTRLNDMFREKTIQKTYWAAVKNSPPKTSDNLIDYLRKNKDKNRSFVEKDDSKGAKKAELSYKLLAKSDYYNLLEVLPKTGRHHQIRVQLSHMGCPIKGDLKYGAKRGNENASIHLHARKIEFIHPVSKEEISITAPTPKDALWIEFESLVS